MKIGRERHADPILEVTDVARAKRRTQGPVKVACIALASFKRERVLVRGPCAKVLRNAQMSSSSSDHADLIMPMGGIDPRRNRNSQSSC